jgi:hypothetical protein
VQGPTTSALSSGKKLYKRRKGWKDSPVKFDEPILTLKLVNIIYDEYVFL